MSDGPNRTNLGRGWKLARSKRSREIVEKVTVSKVRAHGGFRETVKRSMH